MAKRIERILRGLPPVAGATIRLESARGLRDCYGAVEAGSFLRERRIAFSCHPREFPRIFIHELLHFAWVRLGNPKRLAYERLVEAELAAGAAGELGWSAEWRKRKLKRRDRMDRTRRWREYCCESFCDTGAWLFAGLCNHPELTLAARRRAARRRWMEEHLSGGLSI